MPKRGVVVTGLVTLAVLWGLAFVGIKEALAELSPATLTLARFAIADLALIALIPFVPSARPALPREHRGRLVLLALTGVPIYHLALNWGEVRTTAQVASLIVATAPVLLAIGAVVVLGERLSRARIVGIAASFAGVAVLTLGTPQHGDVRITLVGVLAVAVAPIAWAVYTIAAKPLMTTMEPLRVTSTTILLGSLTLLPLLRESTITELQAASPRTWAWLLLLGVGSSVAGYLIFVWLVQHMDASQTGIVLYLVPIVGVAASGWILDEPLGWAVAVAAVLVVSGVALTQRSVPVAAPPEV